MLLSLSGAPRSLYVGRLSPLAASSFPAIFQRKSRLKPRCYWMRRTSLLLSLVMKDDRLCSCGGLVDSRMGSREPGDNASTGSVLAGENRLQPDRLQALGDLSRRRQGLYVYVPASSAGANAHLPGRNPPPRGSCKGVFGLCPPVPLLVAGGTLTFLNIIPTLLSVFDFRTGSAIRGGKAVGAKKPQNHCFPGFAA